MIRLLRTDSTHPDFQFLATELDKYLAIVDGDDHAFYAQYNKNIFDYAVLAFWNDQPLCCGAIKPYAPGTMEIKRMYTHPDARGKGLATQVLLELEKWASELGAETCILETGKRQTDAIYLYEKNGYHVIPNYGQYKNADYSICFEKYLNH
jgi:putative acetyltransferase